MNLGLALNINQLVRSGMRPLVPTALLVDDGLGGLEQFQVDDGAAGLETFDVLAFESQIVEI